MASRQRRKHTIVCWSAVTVIGALTAAILFLNEFSVLMRHQRTEQVSAV